MGGAARVLQGLGRQSQPRGADFRALIKNTYRVLLTRGLLGCYVYFEDDETAGFFPSRIERMADTTT